MLRWRLAETKPGVRRTALSVAAAASSTSRCWFAGTDLDGIRWTQVIKNFQLFNPGLIVPGDRDPGTIDFALNLASHIDSVGRRVTALRQSGKSADEVLRVTKREIVSAYSGWEHPNLVDWEINYDAEQPV